MKWLEQKVSALGRMKDKRIFIKKAHSFQSLTRFNPPSAPDKDVFVKLELYSKSIYRVVTYCIP